MTDSGDRAVCGAARAEDDIAEVIRTAGASGHVQSLARALGALEKLSRHPEGLTLTTLARTIGLPRSTTHRLLTTMDAMQFVMFDPYRSVWKVGPRAFSVGSAFGDASSLARVGRPIISAMHLDCGETVNIVISEAESQVYIGQYATRLATPFTLREGDRLPLHYGAAGKSIMAYWPDLRIDTHLKRGDFTRRTAKSTTDGPTLCNKLKIVFERGYAFDCEENMNDLRCVGAPVFDSKGDPIAALSISAPLGRMPKERMHALGRQLHGAALKVTATLNGVAPRHLH